MPASTELMTIPSSDTVPMKKRLLFVDDDAQVLDALRASLRKRRGQWEMTFVGSGAAALAHIRAAPVDVIVSDMRMPGMDGAELLGEVKEEFPGVIRMILSGHSEQDAVLRALQVSHQFLAKPCEGSRLTSVLEGALNVHGLLHDETIRGVVGKTAQLPSPPRVYLELTRAMQNPNVAPRAIAAILRQDPSVCAKLLQIVNSSYFGLARTIGSVEPAIVYLGLDLVRNLALTAQLFSALDKMPPIPGFSHDRLQERSLMAGRLARSIVSDPKRKDEAFTAGLLHDVGMIILALGAPEKMAEIVARLEREDSPLHVVEKEVLGLTHAEVGAYLLGIWGLPLELIDAVAYHHIPEDGPQTGISVRAAVHIADALVERHLSFPAGATGRYQLEPEYLERLGLAGEPPAWAAMALAETIRCDRASEA